MTTRQEGLPPQGIRTPRGRRGGVTVPGPSASSSDDGLPAALSPSAAGEPTIGGKDLGPFFKVAKRAIRCGVDDGDAFAVVIANVEGFLEAISRYLPPSREDADRQWEFSQVPTLWPSILQSFYMGVDGTAALYGAEESNVPIFQELDSYIEEIWDTDRMPDFFWCQADWERFSPLCPPPLRLQGGGLGSGESGLSGEGDQSSSGSPPHSPGGLATAVVSVAPEDELLALRAEVKLLRAELDREKGERALLRDYVRAHSPFFGAPAGGMVPEASRAPLPAGSVSSPDTVVMEVEGGTAASLSPPKGASPTIAAGVTASLLQPLVERLDAVVSTLANFESRFATLAAKVDKLAVTPLPTHGLQGDMAASTKKKRGRKAPSSVGVSGGRTAPSTEGGSGGRSAPSTVGREGRSAPPTVEAYAGEPFGVSPLEHGAEKPTPPADSFATVVRRGRRRKVGRVTDAPVQGAPPPPPTGSHKGPRTGAAPPPGGSAPPRASRTARAVARARKRLPRSAAVLLMAPPGRYAEALSKARGDISLPDLGITELRPRCALTGALLLEIPGVGNEAKADALASHMRRSLDGMDGVSISRPSRSHELRLRGLDLSVTVGDVASAVADMGGCGKEEVRVGPFRPAVAGLRNVWVRCPARVALRLAGAPGGLRVGWSTAKVDLLALRPTRCFRCLGRGHTQQRCPPSMVDRARCCYNCGREGHGSGSCGSSPHCPICASLGKDARHRAGSLACPPIPPVPRAGCPMPPPSQSRVPRARAASGGSGTGGGSRRGSSDSIGSASSAMDIASGGVEKRPREASGDSPPQPLPKQPTPRARDRSAPRPSLKSRKS